MHSLHEHLLNLWQFDVLLVATFAFHLGRDTANDDNGIGFTGFFGQIVEVYEDTLADVTTQHGKLSVAVLVFNHDVVGLAFLDGERLVLRFTSEAKETTSTSLCLFHHFAIYLQHIAVICGQCVFHLTSKGGYILTTDTYRQCVATYALSKSPGSESGEVQFVVIVDLGRLTR